ncbi:MAG: hypothetical protein H0W39_08665 [Sphingomonas sp.]|nr:hypothetical protein [Sphingomonas sp.]
MGPDLFRFILERVGLLVGCLSLLVGGSFQLVSPRVGSPLAGLIGAADAKLRDKAKAMGASAVVKVRYMPTGASMMSWGGLKAEGVAIRYN